jgi:hypothetical protein
MAIGGENDDCDGVGDGDNIDRGGCGREKMKENKPNNQSPADGGRRRGKETSQKCVI